MKNLIPLVVVTCSVLVLAACAKTASVEGEGSRKLTLVRPAAVTVHRGGMAKADIEIRRQEIPGEVTIRFANLPRGVDVVESDSKIVGEKGSYTLRATDTADLVENHASDVTASAGPGSIAVSQPININVKEKQ
jgi:hypothetical protein